MVKISFYSEDGNKNQIDVKMLSIKSYENFVNKYEFFGGFRRFTHDVWYDIEKDSAEFKNLKFIPNSKKGFEKIYELLHCQSPYYH